MAGAGPIAVGGLAATAAELSPYRCLCSAVDAHAHQASSFHLRSGLRHLGQVRRQLSSAFAGDWPAAGGRLARPSKPRRRQSLLVVAAELGGQYEEGFEDVHLQLINYFTYKAVRTVLHQLYEMNPPKYMWFYNFVATNKPDDGKRFLRLLGKEKQDLAERVMITRLHLYGKWIKKCDHARMYQRISDENLELMRERLIETVIWPSDDTNSERVG
ncbi:unnamed protein product [Spirodela intermedia]|uniref:Uncharacterized protein n=1 Tax=Spirodela intermedia TaxID=51605 RepID=A0A7I8IQ70_SPIIN|nr:unnamed protein product [Spirodela intermedia]CAA6659141.1 unnamed protein product [Spirodela intermedia]